MLPDGADAADLVTLRTRSAMAYRNLTTLRWNKFSSFMVLTTRVNRAYSCDRVVAEPKLASSVLKPARLA